MMNQTSCWIYLFQVAAVDSEGRVMQGCNDCSFDFNGNLWVTAPAGDIAPSPYTRSMEVKIKICIVLII